MERIILNKFDEIEQVKCISGISESGDFEYEYLNLEEDGKAYEINYRNEMDEFSSNKVIIVVVPKKLKYLKEYIAIAILENWSKLKVYFDKILHLFLSKSEILNLNIKDTV